jgi:hypothetical protein
MDRILAAELEMFQTVATYGVNRCLEHPEEFKLHRKAQFSIFSKDTLKSYLNDIIQAQEADINLMTMKYARMDNLILRFNKSPLVDKVAGIMIDWQLELVEKYPDLMQRTRPIESEKDARSQTSFETYLKAELETYSENTLFLLHRDLKKLLAEGKNGSEEIYRYLIKAQNNRKTTSGQD